MNRKEYPEAMADKGPSSYITPEEWQKFLTELKNHSHHTQKFLSVIEAELKRRGISVE